MTDNNSNLTTTQKLAKLTEMRDADNRSLYERACLYRDVLLDREYVAQHFESEAEAAEVLQRRYFPLLVGLKPGQLRELIEHYPTLKHWEDLKFDLQLMLDELPKPDKDIRVSTGPTKAELREQVHDLELENARLKLECANLAHELEKLRTEFENAKLHVDEAKADLAEV